MFKKVSRKEWLVGTIADKQFTFSLGKRVITVGVTDNKLVDMKVYNTKADKTTYYEWHND